MGDSDTAGAFIARIPFVGIFTVKCFSQDASGRGLARSAWTREEIGVVNLVRSDRSLEGANNMVLATKFTESSGTKAAIEGGGVRHRTSVMVTTDIFRASSEVQSDGQAIRGTRLNPLRAAGFHP